MRYLIITSLIIFGSSCKTELKDIEITGQVIDSKTKYPIKNAEVVALCWYYHGIDDASYIKNATLTDKKGKYKFNFDIGYKIDIGTKKRNYLPYRSYNKLTDNSLNVNFYINKRKFSKTLIVRLNTSSLFEDDNKVPFLSQRIYSNPETNEIDPSTFEIWGYDFLNSTNTTNLEKADIWFKKINDQIELKVLKVNEKGGIVPIYQSEVKSSLFFEKTTAPETGYMKEYELNGNEKGFFLKCRDGKHYAKLILLVSEISISSPYKNAYYKESGYCFSSLFQTDKSRTFDYYMDLDLENFLVDYRYK